ncbi:MAG: hypothetical protein AABM67_19945 [Acidobacteriota bacterium]
MIRIVLAGIALFYLSVAAPGQAPQNPVPSPAPEFKQDFPPQVTNLPYIRPNPDLLFKTMKAIRSEAGSFQVSYPTDWTAASQQRDNSMVVFLTSPCERDDDVFNSARVMVCSTAIEKRAWNDCTERDSHLSEMYKDIVRSRTELVIGGLKVERVETASKHDDGVFYYARFTSKDRKFFVRGNFSTSFHFEQYTLVFDQVLVSFQLLGTAKQGISGSNRYYVRVSGCDDGGKAYLNNRLIVGVGFDEDSNWLDITEDLARGKGEIKFEVLNKTGAITYLFQVKKNDTIVFEETCGKARVVGCENNRAFPVGTLRQFTYTIRKS